MQTWLRKNHNAAKFLIAILMLASLACNAFAGNLEPLPEPPQVSERPTVAKTPPVMAPTATLAAASLADQATVTTLLDLNVRSGPGVQYDRVAFLTKGSSAVVVGLDKQSGWWKIECPTVLDSDECWVSGGAQYVAVENVQDVADAEAPATPTTTPPTVLEGQGLLAYNDNGQLYVAGLDLSQNPPRLTSTGKQVSRAAGVQRFSFSPDGRRIAYVSGTESSNSLNSVNADGGDHRTLVTSSILPVAEGQEAVQAAVLIDLIQWLPDGQGVAFNTSVLNENGPGGGSQEDLWFATLDGQLVQSFPAGEGGGFFAFAPDSQVLLSRAAELTRADLADQEQTIILQYDSINTASEYIYYPAPQQTTGAVYIAVPAADPWLPGAETTLWQASPNAPAVEIGRVTDVALDQPLAWSFDGERVAFTQRPGSGDQPLSRMFIAAGDGSDAIPYAGGTSLRFFDWKPEGDQFLYAGAGYYAIGKPQAPPQQILLPTGQAAAEATWLAGDNYILTMIDPANQLWEIRSANLSGESAQLANGSGQQTTLEVWLP